MLDLKKYHSVLEKTNPLNFKGYITEIVGLIIKAQGPKASVGELCYILNDDNKIPCEVMGFKDKEILLMPLDNLDGIRPGSEVVATGKSLQVKVSPQLVGRILDGIGNPLDDQGCIEGVSCPLENSPPHPLKRQRISKPLELGVKAIDGLLACGQGQRMGIFAGSGVGKSTLLGMIARNTEADINVIALIGERGREVREFLEKDLGEEGLKRSIVIVASSDQPPLYRVKGAYTATAIAEYFRDQGKNVLLMMDSVTRFAMALREIGLAVGEPPATRGYTPSVFATLPRLLERSGTSLVGTITGLYTVLVDGDDMNEPIADTVRGILDGHIVLSRQLASLNHFPAIDILNSVSRVMNDLVSEEHLSYAANLRKLLATYYEAKDLIDVGAYVQGSNAQIDLAIKKIDEINKFLTQAINESFSFSETYSKLEYLTKDI
ncbi:MAG: flagellar protein export ATPase FliI [Clostridia bacterium]|jgi:flagellum-specific ATP synthase|nr:flagellar protein export ATPase FliI [Clostridia bacterium]